MQSKWHSFVEAVSGVAFGYALSVAAGLVIYPAFDSEITVLDNMGITLCFTVLSLTRTYATRRFFNWWQHRKKMRKATGMEE